MGYLKDFRTKLDEKLQGLDKTSRQEISDFVASVVLDSYRNGQKSVREEKRDERPNKAARRPQKGA